MSRATARSLPNQFLDVAVIYPSEDEEGMWVAHSLLTDQIGMGTCVLDAFVELRKAIAALLELAKSDPSVAVFRPAPPEVQERLRRAKKLPDEIVEIADMQMEGRFPVRLEKPWTPSARTLSVSIPVSV